VIIVDEKYKASRKGWISGYSTGLARGSGLAFAMVALFALLVVLNPLNFTYAQAYVYTGPETCQEMVYSGGIEIVCETLHPYAVLYWTYFAISVVFYEVCAAVLNHVQFAQTKRKKLR